MDNFANSLMVEGDLVAMAVERTRSGDKGKEVL